MGSCTGQDRVRCFHRGLSLAESGKYEMPLPRAKLPRANTALPSLVVVIGLFLLFADFSWGRLGVLIVLVPLATALARSSVRTAVRSRDRAAALGDRIHGTGATQGPDLRHCRGCQYVLMREGTGESAEHFSTPTHMSGFRDWAEKNGARFAPAPGSPGAAPDQGKG
ncbi:hypothetical protein ABZS81_25555 [Streptomyces sp. NPDC005318]|uniref:hypothetical protein n=1 Tax=Streptomyces sp. NPDC005318 TaxID=3157031 RepID=UPI0033B1A2A8